MSEETNPDDFMIRAKCETPGCTETCKIYGKIVYAKVICERCYNKSGTSALTGGPKISNATLFILITSIWSLLIGPMLIVGVADMIIGLLLIPYGAFALFLFSLILLKKDLIG